MNKQLSHELAVKPEWIDHNGHMNVAYFVLAFDIATDAVYEAWGIGLDYPETSGCSVFTLGMNVDYLGELFVGDNIRIDTSLVDHDSKRIHYFHRMIKADTEQLVATNECLCMNVDLSTRKACVFPEDVSRKLMLFADASGPPKGFGRKLQIRRS